MMSVTAIHQRPEDGPTATDGINRRIAASARRALWDDLVVVGAWATAFALVVFAALLLADAAGIVPNTALTRALVAVGLGVAVEAVGVAIVFVGRPRRIVFARAADRILGLQERISTAAELTARGGPKSVVDRALIADAVARQRQVEPRALTPIRFGLAAAIIASAALFVVLAVAVDSGIGETAGQETASVPPARLSQQEEASVGEDLQRIEAILARDAEERDDPFLAAVAREVGDLERQVEAGQIADRAALAEALDQLAGYAAEAYELGGEAAGSPEDLSRLLDTLAQSVRSPSPQPSQPPEIAAAPAAGPSADQSEAQDETTPQDLDDMLAEAEAEQMLEDARQFSPSPNLDGEGANAQQSDYYVAAAAEQARLRAQQMNNPPEELAGGALAGAAANAEGGDSRIAGEGVSELGDAEGENDPFAVVGEMTLEDELDAEGRRITIDVPPEEMDITLDPGDVVAGAWAPLPEEEVTRFSSSPTIRDILSRYFRASAEAEVAE